MSARVITSVEPVPQFKSSAHGQSSDSPLENAEHGARHDPYSSLIGLRWSHQQRSQGLGRCPPFEDGCNSRPGLKHRDLCLDADDFEDHFYLLTRETIYQKAVDALEHYSKQLETVEIQLLLRPFQPFRVRDHA